MTPAVEAVREAGIDFELHEYEGVEVGDGDYALGVATALGVEPGRLYKTLLASVDGKLQVFVIPAEHETIPVSAGRRGLQLELDPRELIRLTAAEVRPVARE